MQVYLSGENTGELLLRPLEDAALIALEPQEIVGSKFLSDRSGGFLLTMHRVGCGERSVQSHACQERFDRRDSSSRK
jgi:hypothetical protein